MENDYVSYSTSAVATLPTHATQGIAETKAISSHDFFNTVHEALGAVSGDQAAATAAEAAVAENKPGASTASAVVLSDRAELGWNAAVAVRNEVVAAYQTVMNMQI